MSLTPALSTLEVFHTVRYGNYEAEGNYDVNPPKAKPESAPRCINVRTVVEINPYTSKKSNGLDEILDWSAATTVNYFIHTSCQTIQGHHMGTAILVMRLERRIAPRTRSWSKEFQCISIGTYFRERISTDGVRNVEVWHAKKRLYHGSRQKLKKTRALGEEEMPLRTGHSRSQSLRIVEPSCESKQGRLLYQISCGKL